MRLGSLGLPSLSLITPSFRLFWALLRFGYFRHAECYLLPIWSHLWYIIYINQTVDTGQTKDKQNGKRNRKQDLQQNSINNKH